MLLSVSSNFAGAWNMSMMTSKEWEGEAESEPRSGRGQVYQGGWGQRGIGLNSLSASRVLTVGDGSTLEGVA